MAVSSAAARSASIACGRRREVGVAAAEVDELARRAGRAASAAAARMPVKYCSGRRASRVGAGRCAGRGRRHAQGVAQALARLVEVDELVGDQRAAEQRRPRQRGQRGDPGGERDQREQDDRPPPGAARLSVWTLRSRNATWASEVERDAAAQADGRDGLQRLVDVPERLLDAEREQHDPGDHRQVQVGVGVARDARALRRRRASKRRSATSATTSKYAHHSAAATATPSSDAGDQPASSGMPCAPTPSATIDSPSAMMMISPKRSAKWPACTRQPSTPTT